MYDPDHEPPQPPLAFDEAGIRAERVRDSGPITRRRDQLDKQARTFWGELFDRMRAAETLAYAAGVHAGRTLERTATRRRTGRGREVPISDLTSALLAEPPRTGVNDLYRDFAALRSSAEEFGRALAAAVRDVFDAWELGQNARQRMEAPRIDDLITDGSMICIGDECLLTRPVTVPDDEGTPEWSRPILTNPKPWPRARLQWRVRDEVERLLRARNSVCAGPRRVPPSAERIGGGPAAEL